MSHELRVRELECERDARFLFRDLNLQIRAGGAALIEGRNGAGKTSLLRILTGLRPADGGEVLWNGESITALGTGYREQLLYVGHRNGIKDDLTVLENLRMYRSLKASRAVDESELLRRLALAAYEDVPVRHLSAGQRRRVALSRLLMSAQALWILDEPFTSLDREGIALFEELIDEHLQAGGLALLTAHHDVRLDDSRVQRLKLS